MSNDYWSAVDRLSKDVLVGDVVVNQKPSDDWRKAVIANADNQCENIDNGNRCPVTGTGNLRAISFQPGSKDPKDGVALCPRHSDQVEGKAVTPPVYPSAALQSRARG